MYYQNMFIQTKKRSGSVVSSTYSLPLSSMTAEELEDEKKKMTLQAKVGFGTPPPPFKAYFINEGRFHVPRFYGLERFGEPEIDNRTLGKEIQCQFEGSNTETQKRALVAILNRCYNERKTKGCIAVLPCGFGKTVLAISLICLLKRKTIVFVHKTILADQWIDRIKTFAPHLKIGKIQGDVFDIDADVVIAMVLTVSKKGFNSSDFDEFGFSIFDECHHMAAPIMNLATLLLNSMYVLGLTATKERVDGLTPLLHWCLGPEGFRYEGETETTKVTCMIYNGGNKKEICYRDGQPAMSLMINRIAEDEKRCEYIAKRMKVYWSNKRHIIVLSDRISQLKSICRLLLEIEIPEEDIGFLIGSTHKRDRSSSLEKKIVMCTYSMANEGLDKKVLDCLIMATPKGNVTQAIGRIQRPCEQKQVPLVLDVIDDYSLFSKLRWKRYSYYTKKKFECQTIGCNSDDFDFFL
tara:strand:- start:548 stop:1942 length:1395 start_codon:yes stop_codon:yes gene_type:complete